jgi:hypothetical protein
LDDTHHLNVLSQLTSLIYQPEFVDACENLPSFRCAARGVELRQPAGKRCYSRKLITLRLLIKILRVAVVLGLRAGE